MKRLHHKFLAIVLLLGVLPVVAEILPEWQKLPILSVEFPNLRDTERSDIVGRLGLVVGKPVSARVIEFGLRSIFEKGG